MADQLIRVTKEFRFETAHALYGHDGPCRHIHGHSYRLSVTVSGFPEKDDQDPKKGMVIDFYDVKQIVKEKIVDPFDHALLVDGSSPFKVLAETGDEHFSNVVLCDYQPTCENMLVDMVSRIKDGLPKVVTLERMRLRETATSHAEWNRKDNE